MNEDRRRLMGVALAGVAQQLISELAPKIPGYGANGGVVGRDAGSLLYQQRLDSFTVASGLGAGHDRHWYKSKLRYSDATEIANAVASLVAWDDCHPLPSLSKRQKRRSRHR